MVKSVTRCTWCGEDPLYVAYHDYEWGVPIHDDKKLFEFIILEGAQAGLSWITILRKRENYREAFAGFDVEKVAAFDKRKVNTLLKNPGIIRNRLKVESTVTNARAFIRIQEEFGSFSKYQWEFVNGGQIVGKVTSLKDIPAKTEIAERFSLDLKKRGLKFVGPTIVYAHMQAVGMVNDHFKSCFRYKQVGKEKI